MEKISNRMGKTLSSTAEQEEALRRSDADLTAEAKTDKDSTVKRKTFSHASTAALVTEGSNASSDTKNKSTAPAVCPFAHHHSSAKAGSKSRCPFARLNVVSNTHKSTDGTEKLLKFIGGAAALKRSISRFYKYAFANPHLARFFRDPSDPHALRLSSWIAEKMGDKRQPWTRERRKRDMTPKIIAGGRTIVVHDRSSAHVAAWYSPKREAHKAGQHFKLDDCRLWLRLNFLAAREEGLFKHANFKDWYVRFLGHFVRVYERSAPQFVRDAARWSESKKRVTRYHEAVSKGLPEAAADAVIGLSYTKALRQIPEEEWSENTMWPYEQQQQNHILPYI